MPDTTRLDATRGSRFRVEGPRGRAGVLTRNRRTRRPTHTLTAALRSTRWRGLLGNRSRGGCLRASEIQVAPPVEADLPLLFGLAKGTFASLPGWSDERVLGVLRRDLIFVAREEGRPAGYVALRREEGGAIVVEQLFVAPGHERRGIGDRLLAYAEGYAIAERAPSLHVVVEQSNQVARRFY